MDIVEYTDFLVKSLVNDPDMIKVEALDDEKGKNIVIMVPNDDMKYVLGKNGKSIKAIRTLVSSYAYLHKLHNIKVTVEPF